MKLSKKIIGCAAAAAVLGIGVSTAFAAQTDNNIDLPDSDIINEIELPEQTVPVQPESSEPVSTVDTVSLASEESDITVPEAPEENASFIEDWASRPHTPPIANAPEDFDYSGYREKVPAELYSEIYAVDDGVVIYTDPYYNRGFGTVVVVKHADNAYTIYGHLDYNFEVVQEGDTVKAGQLIGYSGDTGDTYIPSLLYRFTDTEPFFFKPEDFPHDDTEKNASYIEDWASRPHTPPIANAPEDFDYSGCLEEVYTEPNSEIYAVNDGVVIYTDPYYNGGFGSVVVVKHADNAYTAYGHLEYEVVQEGDTVKAGQLIGYSGDSGSARFPSLLYRFSDNDPGFYPHSALLQSR